MKNTASRCRGYFYPRSPCGERRLSYFYIIKITQFLSTLSLRRATQQDGHQHAGYPISIHALLAESDHPFCTVPLAYTDFYPRSPCGERPFSRLPIKTARLTISIHALLAESDTQSFPALHHIFISIHALLAESDRKLPMREPTALHFYPRSPCGERLDKRCEFHRNNGNFYPRSPCGERPRVQDHGGCVIYISIHALLAESDLSDLRASL